MIGWRSRSWLPALMAGYLLFSAILFAETAYILPRLLLRRSPFFPAEFFRAGWFRAGFRFAPVRGLVWGPCQQWRHLSVALLLAAVFLLGLGYLGALRAVQRQPEGWSLRRLLGLALLAALPLALLLPPTSGDYVAYLFTGRMLSAYHVNPWRHVLAEFPVEQTYLSPMAWGANLQCVYGPAWAVVPALTTGLGNLLAHGPLTFASLMLNVLLLRGANGLALAAAGVAVWRINGRLWPGQQRLVTAAFLLNPLLVYEAIGALHNDIWGVAFLLWTCALFLRDDGRYVLPLALSFLTKYIVLAMVPFIGVYYWRRRDWRRLGCLVATVLISLGVVLLTSVPGLSAHLSASRNRFLLTPTCLPQFIAMVITLARGLPTLNGALVRASSQVLTAIYVLIYLALVGRTRTREQVITHSLWALLLYFAGAYMQTVPWYYMWPLGLLCAIRWGQERSDARGGGAGWAANAAWGSTLILLGYGVHLWNHAGLRGWDSWTLVPGFLMAIAVPALVGLAGHCRWWRVCALPAHAFDEGKRSPVSDQQSAKAALAER